MGEELISITTTYSNAMAPVSAYMPDDTIVLAQYDAYETKRLYGQLSRAGFTRLLTFQGLEPLESYLAQKRCDLLFLDFNSATGVDETLSFLERQRSNGFRGLAALTSRTTTKELFFRAARCGANDFLIKGRNLDIAAEASRMLASENELNTSEWNPNKIASVGFLRTLGITKSEMDLLVEFTRDFSRQKNLAQRVAISEPSIRKSFSRIYKKLSRAFDIENTAQLSHILTICSLYA